MNGFDSSLSKPFILLLLLYMKYQKIILIVFFLTILFESKAQFSISPSIGLGISSFSNIDAKGMNPLIGYNVGINLHYAFSNRWGVQSGFYLIQKGANDVNGFINIEEDLFDKDIVSVDVKMNYLKLPITFSMTQKLHEEMYIRMNVGAFASYGVFGKGTISRIDQTYSTGIDPFEEISFNTKEHGKKIFPKLNNWDIGCDFSLELIMYKVKIGLLYELGLSHISKQFPVRYDNNLCNRTFSICIGYILPLN